MAIHRNKLISSLINDVFSLSDDDFAILHGFAKKGETTRHQIVTRQDKKTVSKRINILLDEGFLILRKQTPFRNQPHKSTKYFGLSFKGYLASLRYCNVEENYLTKKYLNGIKDKILSKLILDYIKDDLIHFFSYNSYRGLVLNKMHNISDWFDNYISLSGFSEDDEKYLKIVNDNHDSSWDALSNSLPKITNIGTFVENWYHYMDDFANGSDFSQIMKEMGDPLDPSKPLWEQITGKTLSTLLREMPDEYPSI